MEQQARNETREYAWKYFALHADQRLRTFNFYLLIVGLILGGLLAYLKDARHPAYACPVGLLLIVLSYIFRKLDSRAYEFIENGEAVLKAIEKDIPADQVPEALRIFVGEDANKEQRRKECGTPRWWSPRSWWCGHWGVHTCFSATFLIFGLMGAVITVIVFFLPGSPPPAVPPVPQQDFYIGNQSVNPAP